VKGWLRSQARPGPGLGSTLCTLVFNVLSVACLGRSLSWTFALNSPPHVRNLEAAWSSISMFQEVTQKSGAKTKVLTVSADPVLGRVTAPPSSASRLPLTFGPSTLLIHSQPLWWDSHWG
jgi:hypothetical protein